MDERWFEVAGFWIRTQRRGAAKKMRAYRSFGFIVAQTTIPLVPCAVSETVAISSSTLLSLIPLPPWCRFARRGQRDFDACLPDER